jgi:hypothetical protein
MHSHHVAVTSNPEVKRTRTTFRIAEFGFFCPAKERFAVKTFEQNKAQQDAWIGIA